MSFFTSKIDITQNHSLRLNKHFFKLTHMYKIIFIRFILILLTITIAPSCNESNTQLKKIKTSNKKQSIKVRSAFEIKGLHLGDNLHEFNRNRETNQKFTVLNWNREKIKLFIHANSSGENINTINRIELNNFSNSGLMSDISSIESILRIYQEKYLIISKKSRIYDLRKMEQNLIAKLLEFKNFQDFLRDVYRMRINSDYYYFYYSPENILIEIQYSKDKYWQKPFVSINYFFYQDWEVEIMKHIKTLENRINHLSTEEKEKSIKNIGEF